MVVSARLRRCVPAGLVLAVLLPGVSQAGSASNGVPELRARIDQLLAARRVPRANVGIKIVSLTEGQVLYSLNPEKSFSPASTMKMVTMAAALELLGENFRWRTELWHDGVLQDGTLNGNLYVKGYGNPYFMELDMEELVRLAVKASVQRVTGAIYFDDSYFDDVQVGPGVNPQSTSLYDPRESALSYGFNILRVTIAPGFKAGDRAVVNADPPSSHVPVVNKAVTVAGPTKLSAYRSRDSGRVVVSGQISRRAGLVERYFKISEPERFFAAAFLDKLRAAGVEFQGDISRGRVRPVNLAFQVLGTHQSPALRDLLWMLGKKSNNFVAEQLFKTVGAEVLGAPGSFETGSRVLTSYLEKLGHDPATFTIMDGSGLSRDNRLTPDTLMSVLQYIYESDVLRPAFVDSLAWAGMDGTLVERLSDSATSGRVFAKTGSLFGVSALSGYVAAPRRGDLAFSIMVNGSAGRSSAKKVEDAILRLLAGE